MRTFKFFRLMKMLTIVFPCCWQLLTNQNFFLVIDKHYFCFCLAIQLYGKDFSQARLSLIQFLLLPTVMQFFPASVSSFIPFVPYVQSISIGNQPHVQRRHFFAQEKPVFLFTKQFSTLSIKHGKWLVPPQCIR